MWPQQTTVDRKRRVGVRVRVEQPVVDLALPDLRIIDPELEARVKARLDQERARYLRKVDGTITGKLSKTAVESKYLLSSLARCAVCGGAMVADRKLDGSKNAVNVYYRCSIAWKGGGKTRCTNAGTVPAVLIEAAVVSAVGNFADPAYVLDTVLGVLAQAQAAAPDTAEQKVALQKRLVEIGAAKKNLVNAIASGKAHATLVEALDGQEKAEAETRAALARLESKTVEPVPAQAVEEEIHPVIEATRALLDTWKTEPARARHALAKLGVKVEVSPATGKRGARQVPLRITGSYDGLVPKFPTLAALATPTGLRFPGQPHEPYDRELVDPVVYPPSLSGGSDGGQCVGQLTGITDARPPPRPPPGEVARAEPALGVSAHGAQPESRSPWWGVWGRGGTMRSRPSTAE